MAATETASLDQVIRWLGNIQFADFSAALDKCRIAIIASTKSNFAGSHAPDGTPWAPLRFSRPGSKGSDKPLRDKGILAASVTARGAQGNYEKRTPMSLEWGSNLEKAGLHQHGGKVTPKSARSLSIPLTREAARAGSPWNMQGLRYQFARGPKLRGFLVQDKTKGKGKKSLTQAIQQYMLVSEVDVPARPFLGWSDELVEECENIIADSAVKAIVNAPVNGNGARLSA